MHPRLLLSFASLSAIGVFAQKIDHPDSIQVGFNLQDTYGTVAISYPNGTLVGIGRANGGDGYRKLMEKYSDSSNMHLAWASP